jgi:hypothetical protein
VSLLRLGSAMYVCNGSPGLGLGLQSWDYTYGLGVLCFLWGNVCLYLGFTKKRDDFLYSRRKIELTKSRIDRMRITPMAIPVRPSRKPTTIDISPQPFFHSFKDLKSHT